MTSRPTSSRASIWQASKVLPGEMLDALPHLGRSDKILTRQDLTRRQPA